MKNCYVRMRQFKVAKWAYGIQRLIFSTNKPRNIFHMDGTSLQLNNKLKIELKVSIVNLLRWQLVRGP